jgi:ribosomal protein L12E/L44/L45/RPP1/RPP2
MSFLTRMHAADTQATRRYQTTARQWAQNSRRSPTPLENEEEEKEEEEEEEEKEGLVSCRATT